jgi:hypothetical protein
LKTGFVIEKIDGKTTRELLAPVEASFAKRTLPEAQKRIYRERILMNYFSAEILKPKLKLKLSTAKISGRFWK